MNENDINENLKGYSSLLSDAIKRIDGKMDKIIETSEKLSIIMKDKSIRNY